MNKDAFIKRNVLSVITVSNIQRSATSVNLDDSLIFAWHKQQPRDVKISRLYNYDETNDSGSEKVVYQEIARWSSTNLYDNWTQNCPNGRKYANKLVLYELSATREGKEKVNVLGSHISSKMIKVCTTKTFNTASWCCRIAPVNIEYREKQPCTCSLFNQKLAHAAFSMIQVDNHLVTVYYSYTQSELCCLRMGTVTETMFVKLANDNVR